MTKSEANVITGGLSNPSKMPGKAYSLPAKECQTGGLLRKIPGSVCSKCYAHKGRYGFPNVQKALYRRLNAVNEALRTPDGHGRWIHGMITLISLDRHFRFHDSGDVQSIDHLNLYADLAHCLPGCRFWLPTKEAKIAREYVAQYSNPENLVVRLSASMIDGNGQPSWIPGSHVWTRDKITTQREPLELYPDVVVCPAPTQGNVCGDCRACWDPEMRTVIYIKH